MRISIVLIIVALFFSCKQNSPEDQLPAESSLFVSPQINLADTICYGVNIPFNIDLKGKDGLMISSFTITTFSGLMLLELKDLDFDKKLSWNYISLEEDIGQDVVLIFEMTDGLGQVFNESVQLMINEDFKYVSNVTPIPDAFDLKNNVPLSSDHPNADVQIITETQSCGPNCLLYKHQVKALNGARFYSFPDDYNYSIGNRALKSESLKIEMASIESHTEIIAYNAFEDEIDPELLYINNTPLIFEIGDNNDVVVFQIANPTGLWVYKKLKETSGQ